MFGCFKAGIKGNGNIIDEERQIDSFNKLDLSGAFDVIYDVGETTKVKIIGESNLLKYVKTENFGKTLSIFTKKNISSNKKIVIYITNPPINEVNLSGANNLTIKNLKNDNLFINLSGAGNISINGTVDLLKANLSGAGKLDSKELEAHEVDIEISGTASADVFVTEKLNASVSGVGSINYYGNPKFTNNKISGIGSINKK
jgi:hypothetical protein